ncbi:hypothetical protein QFZ99_007547 [Paraburkholderia atlantica]
MPGCNGPDRGCNITSRESALTSVRCSGAKLLSDSVEGSMREHRSRCLRPPLRRENLGMAMRRRQLDGAGCTNVCGLGMLEPYAGKLARTVLRGGCAGNGVALPAHTTVFLTNNKQESMVRPSFATLTLDAVLACSNLSGVVVGTVPRASMKFAPAAPMKLCGFRSLFACRGVPQAGVPFTSSGFSRRKSREG